MLDAFKKGQSKPAQQQALDLEKVIATSREERAALSTMLTQIQLQSSKLAAAGKALQDVEQLVTNASTRIDQVSDRLKTVETRSAELEAIEGRIRTLVETVSKAEDETSALIGPDGRLQHHREAIDALASEAAQARESVEALRGEHAGIRQIRGDVQRSSKDAAAAAKTAATLQDQIDRLASLSSEVSAKLQQMEEGAVEAHKRTTATAEIVRDVETRLGVLPELQEMSRATEERLTSLNALAEHVSQKVKVLENQKHTVERAVVESNRLNEMIWNMEIQIKKLDDAARHAATVEETVDHVEKIARDVASQLESGIRARDAFAREIKQLEQARVTLSDVVRTHLDRIDVERGQLSAFDERVRTLSDRIASLEGNVEALAEREGRVTSIAARVDQLSRDMSNFGDRADAALERQAALDALERSLVQVDNLARTTAARYEAVAASRQHLDRVREEMDAFRTTHTEAVRMRDSLNSDRMALESFIQRLDEFNADVPGLQARMEGVTGRMHVLEEANRKADALASAADALEQRAARLGSQRQLVEQVEHRLGKLNDLVAETDRKLKDQYARRSEMEALENEIDRVSIRVTETRQKLDDVAAVEEMLAPLHDRLAAFEDRINQASRRVESLRVSDAELVGQERRLAELLVGSRAAAEAAAERLTQVTSLSGQLEKSQSVKDELLAELARVEAKQKDVATHLETADEQVQQLQAAAAGADARRKQLTMADKRMGAIQARLEELHGLTEDVDRRVHELGQREAIVEAVRRQVEAVHAVGLKSRADLEYVEAHRNEMAVLRERVDELLGCIGETESRLSSIHGRRQLVDEVQVKTSVILNMLEDVRLNVETLGEQRAVMDHAIESCNRLGEMVREAQSTIKGLQTERELAERIQKGIRQLRAKTAGEPEERALSARRGR
jgi:chromosome segregation ATPase